MICGVLSKLKLLLAVSFIGLLNGNSIVEGDVININSTNANFPCRYGLHSLQPISLFHHTFIQIHHSVPLSIISFTHTSLSARPFYPEVIAMDSRLEYMSRLLDYETEQHNATKSLLFQFQIQAQSWERAYLIANSELQFAQSKISVAETTSQQMSAENVRLNNMLNCLVVYQIPRLVRSLTNILTRCLLG